MSQLIIKAKKCTLVLEEAELMACLAAKPDIFEKAIQRGKGLLRSEKTKRWQERQLSAKDEK